MHSRRHFLSLITALSLSTLAAADSITKTTSLQPAHSAPYGISQTQTTVLITTPNASMVMPFDSYSNRHRAPQYIPVGRPGVTAPEPGSLMLLSTGLLGLSGLLRRKLVRR